jgi:hypothetical protein
MERLKLYKSTRKKEADVKEENICISPQHNDPVIDYHGIQLTCHAYRNCTKECTLISCPNVIHQLLARLFPESIDQLDFWKEMRAIIIYSSIIWLMANLAKLGPFLRRLKDYQNTKNHE